MNSFSCTHRTKAAASSVRKSKPGVSSGKPCFIIAASTLTGRSSTWASARSSKSKTASRNG